MLRPGLMVTLMLSLPSATACSTKKSSHVPLAPIPGPNEDDETGSLTLNSSVQASLVPDEQAGLPAPYAYATQKAYGLSLEDHAEVSIADFSAGAACDPGAQQAGPFLTIMSNDKPMVTSDSVKFGGTAVKNASDLTASLDAGKYKVIVSFYSDKPCRSVGVNFSLAGSPAHTTGTDGTTTEGDVSPTTPDGTAPVLSEELDRDLFGGTWLYLQNYEVEYSMAWSSSRQSMRATAFGGAVYYDADIKTEVDTKATPKKMRVTVIKINAIESGVSLKVGDQRLCIYQVHYYDMMLECSDYNALSFPKAFTAKTMAFHQD